MIVRASWIVAPSFSLLMLIGACPETASSEITRERAIDIARTHVTFEPVSIEAKKLTSDGQPVWEITFRGRTGEAHPIREIMIVTIDRRTGEVVSIGKS